MKKKNKYEVNLVVKDKLDAEDIEILDTFVEKYGMARIIARPLAPSRTLEMNAYYWGIVIEKICEWLGWGKNEAHEFIKHNFFADEDSILDILSFLDEDPVQFAYLVLNYVSNLSTTDISEEDFKERMKAIRTYFSHAENGGIWIPAPWEPDTPGIYH